MQFQFLKGRYCLSFAVLFHFGRVPIMHTPHGHLINFAYLLAASKRSLYFHFDFETFFFLISLNFEF